MDDGTEIAMVKQYYKLDCVAEYTKSDIDECDFSPCGMDGVQEINQSCGKGIAPKWCKKVSQAACVFIHSLSSSFIIISNSIYILTTNDS